MFSLFKDHSDKAWIIAYFNFKMPASKAFAKKLQAFLEDVNWQLFVNRKLTTLPDNNAEIHVAPQYDATLSPKQMIKVHFKLIQFSRVLSKYLKLPKPEYVTELSIKNKVTYVIHRYGALVIIYDIKDRIRLEQNPFFTGISSKMFVESVEDIRKHMQVVT